MLFPLLQGGWRNVQAHGMQKRYIADQGYEILIKKFFALSFCNLGYLPERYEMLVNTLIRDHGDNDQHHDFLEYFENTWVGRERRNPRFHFLILFTLYHNIK